MLQSHGSAVCCAMVLLSPPPLPSCSHLRTTVLLQIGCRRRPRLSTEVTTTSQRPPPGAARHGCLVFLSAMPCPCHVMSGRLARSHGGSASARCIANMTYVPYLHPAAVVPFRFRGVLHCMICHAMPCQYVVRRDEWRAMSGNAARRRRVSTCSSRVRLDVCACSVYERAV